MALNSLKCNHLTPLRFKGLNYSNLYCTVTYNSHSHLTYITCTDIDVWRSLLYTFRCCSICLSSVNISISVSSFAPMALTLISRLQPWHWRSLAWFWFFGLGLDGAGLVTVPGLHRLINNHNIPSWTYLVNCVVYVCRV